MELSAYPTPSTDYQELTAKLSAPYPTPYPTPKCVSMLFSNRKCPI